MRLLPTVTALVLAVSHASANEPAGLRRLHDFTPVSANNPVIARVEKCGIEIPLSEFRVYVRSMTASESAAWSNPLTLADKRRLLEGLLDDHFLLWDGYQKKADQTPEIAGLLQSTETMLLQETFLQQEVAGKARTQAEFDRLSQKLRDDLFEKTDITVSVEAYDELKATLRRLHIGPGSTNAAVRAVDLGPLSNRPLARCRAGAVTVGDVLQFYVQTPATNRVNLEKQEALTGILKSMLEDALLAQAARDKGLEKAPIVVEKMQSNRNNLTRMYALDRITDQAVARMKERGTADRLIQWYEANRKTRYTYQDAQGKQQVVPFDRNQETIEDDYFQFLNEQLRDEYLRTLRRDRPAEINEALLEKAVVAPFIAAPTELSASMISWNSDTQEHVVQRGETNAIFQFQFTNTSSEEITLFEIKPSCECTTIRNALLPWKLGPGEKGQFEASVDLRNKTNSYNRSIQIESSHGSKTLTLKITLPSTACSQLQRRFGS